jgi:ketosteroid isomerase-like protein
MHANEALIRRFYDAFARRDGDAMAACYSPDIAFSDPVFPMLRGEEAGDMWRMLVGRAADLSITLDRAAADDEGGSAQWTARYTFSRTGHKVVNVIEARFAFRDGKIVRHVDLFPFWRWASQALGPVGKLLGWFGPLKAKVRSDAAKGLAAFREKRAAESGHREAGS